MTLARKKAVFMLLFGVVAVAYLWYRIPRAGDIDWNGGRVAETEQGRCIELHGIERESRTRLSDHEVVVRFFLTPPPRTTIGIKGFGFSSGSHKARLQLEYVLRSEDGETIGSRRKVTAFVNGRLKTFGFGYTCYGSLDRMDRLYATLPLDSNGIESVRLE